MAHTKKVVTAEAPKGTAAWHAETDDAALLLWGQANRLRNELNAARSRRQALSAAVEYLHRVRLLVHAASGDTLNPDTGATGIRWLRQCTSDRFTTEAVVLAGGKLA